MKVIAFLFTLMVFAIVLVKSNPIPEEFQVEEEDGFFTKMSQSVIETFNDSANYVVDTLNNWTSAVTEYLTNKRDEAYDVVEAIRVTGTENINQLENMISSGLNGAADEVNNFIPRNAA